MATSGGDVQTTATAEDRKKSKKPSDSKFKQQRLPAWQPVMTAKSVIPAFFIIGVIFVPVGAVLYWQASLVKEIVIDYTMDSCQSCYDSLNTTDAHSDAYQPCVCTATFQLAEDFQKPVYMYYGLDNFYQNHRRYVKSRDDTQLLGKVMSSDNPSNKLTTDCEPFRTNAAGQLYAPCGAIANSLFNDTLTLLYHGAPSGPVSVPLLKRGIAWPSDKESKFQNPTDSPDNLCAAAALKDTVKPPNWKRPLCELDLNDTENNGYLNEDLIVWMRTAALPNFRKLYRLVDHAAVTSLKDSLPAGNYTLTVEYNYPVKEFSGRKKMILSTVSAIGGKNPFLGIAYIVVGGLCVLIAIAFVIIHLKYGKRIEEIVDVTDRTPYTARQ